MPGPEDPEVRQAQALCRELRALLAESGAEPGVALTALAWAQGAMVAALFAHDEDGARKCLRQANTAALTAMERRLAKQGSRRASLAHLAPAGRA